MKAKEIMTTVNNTLSSFLPTPSPLSLSLSHLFPVVYPGPALISHTQCICGTRAFSFGYVWQKWVFRTNIPKSCPQVPIKPVPLSLLSVSLLCYAARSNLSQFHHSDLFLTKCHTQEEGTMHEFCKVVQLLHKNKLQLARPCDKTIQSGVDFQC